MVEKDDMIHRLFGGIASWVLVAVIFVMACIIGIPTHEGIQVLFLQLVGLVVLKLVARQKL